MTVEFRLLSEFPRKTIVVEKLNSGDVRLIETMKGFTVAIDLPLKLVLWLAEHLDFLPSDLQREGFAGRRVEGDFEMILKIRKKQGGTFMAFLVLSKHFKTGWKFLCWPKMVAQGGWRNLSLALWRMVRNQKKDATAPTNLTQRRTEFPARNEKTSLPRLVISGSSETCDWESYRRQ